MARRRRIRLETCPRCCQHSLEVTEYGYYCWNEECNHEWHWTGRRKKAENSGSDGKLPPTETDEKCPA